MTNATTPSRSSRSTGTTTGGGPGAPSASGSSSAAAGSASAATYADAAAGACSLNLGARNTRRTDVCAVSRDRDAACTARPSSGPRCSGTRRRRHGRGRDPVAVAHTCRDQPGCAGISAGYARCWPRRSCRTGQAAVPVGRNPGAVGASAICMEFQGQVLVVAIDQRGLDCQLQR